MGSAFEQQFAAQLPTLYAQFGLPAVHKSPAGVVTAGLTVIVDREDARQVDDSVRATGEMQNGKIRVMQSALAKVEKGSRFTVDAIGAGTGQVEVWTVEATPRLANGQHYCTVSRGGIERLMTRGQGKDR